MPKKSKLYKLSINTDALIRDIFRYYLKALDRAEDRLIELMRQEIQKTTHGGAPGKPEWRNQISAMLKEVSREVTADYIKAEVGLSDKVLGTFQWLLVRAMIIAEGSGSEVGNPPIQAGPYGREVWNSSLTGKKPSKAMTTYYLPAAFNQEGNHFIENAVKLMKKEYEGILDEAARNMPANIVARHVNVR